MPTREIQEYFDSGEVDDIKIEGTDEEQSVITGDGSKPVKILQFKLLNEATKPPHKNGQLYFNNDRKTLIVQSGVNGEETEIGHNMHVHVVNNSGAIIIASRAVKADGAQADTFENATVIGIVSKDIGIGEQGTVMTGGILRNQNTLGATTGVTQYLSATNAGEFTEVRQDIVTILGKITIADATNGEGFIKIENNQVLPLMLGSLLDATAPTSLPADLINGTPVTDYTDDIEVVTTVNKITGTITPLLDGTYRVNISLHMEFDNVGGAGKKEIFMDVVDITDNVVVKTIKGFILKDAETYVITDNGGIKNIIGGHEYRLELRSELALTNFAFSSSTYYLESIKY